MPRGNRKQLVTFPIMLPPLPYQKKIAEILSNYDNLIENYREQIKLLERSAQRIYEEWFVNLKFPGYEKAKFVDGLPEDWERKSVSELGEYLNGYAFKPSDWQDTGKPIIKIKEMGSGISNDTPRNNGKNIPDRYLIKSGDILFSWSATLMVKFWDGEEGWLNQHLFKVTPSKNISKDFLLQSIANAIAEFSNLTTGSTMKHIQRNRLEMVYVNIPTLSIMNEYGIVSDEIRNKISNLSNQIRNLSKTRNLLIPKLMSGEIELNIN